MKQKIRMMALATGPIYKEAVAAAQIGISEINKSKASNFKVYWKPFKRDDEYHIRIYYDWEYDDQSII